MLPTINGKSVMDCNYDDFESILDNPDFKETESIDYKGDFSIYKYEKQNPKRQAEISEFRSDICSFANSNDGYLIYGINEKDAIPHEISGVDLSCVGKDNFELNVKTWLQLITPRIPNYKIKFIDIPTENNKYIIVFLIFHDFFAPYLHIEDEKNYRIFKRVGNSKSTVTYSELKNMFTQGINLEKEIESFRRERIAFFTSQENDDQMRYSRFMLFHVIPETIVDSNYNKPAFVLEQNRVPFSSIFKDFSCDTFSKPTVNGLRYYSWNNSNNECQLYNNGIAEVFVPLELGEYIDSQSNFLYTVTILGKIQNCLKQYDCIMQNNFDFNRYYVCMSIIGCKGATTEFRNVVGADGIIDRTYLLCNPVEYEFTPYGTSINFNKLTIELCLSFGIKNSDKLKEAIKNEYGTF